jgi:hypothetical protein
MIYAPEVIVSHAHPLTLRTFWWQHFNYGRGAFRFHRARARRGSGFFRSDLVFYARLPALLRQRFLERPGAQALLLTALLAVWQGANAAGVWWEAAHQRAEARAGMREGRQRSESPR